MFPQGDGMLFASGPWAGRLLILGVTVEDLGLLVLVGFRVRMLGFWLLFTLITKPQNSESRTLKP